MKHWLHAGLVLLTVTLALVLSPATLAWQNDSSVNDSGTITVQQWILQEAVSAAAAAGADWVDLSSALPVSATPTPSFAIFPTTATTVGAVAWVAARRNAQRSISS